MHQEALKKLVPQYLKGHEFHSAETLQGGIINATYLVTTESREKLVLQLVNTDVFTEPERVMGNVKAVTDHLRKVAPESRNLSLLSTVAGESFVIENGLWRAFSYLDGCIGYEVVNTEDQAYEAGFAFGQFLRQLDGIEPTRLSETLPDFHHTPKRLIALDEAVAEDKCDRKKEVLDELGYIESCRGWISTVEDLRKDGKLPERVTHNDTKISNVLFDQVTNKAVCVIDLDTVMSGTMLYDFGDLVRTSVNSSSEDDGVEAVECRLNIFEFLSKGYLDAAGEVLTQSEKDHLVFSAKLITLELSIRFLTDYLNGDQYFKVTHERQNLQRAKNQLRLVDLLERRKDEMQNIINQRLEQNR